MRHLPWRGPIASPLAGAPLGFVAYLMRGRPLNPLYFVVGGFAYGALIGWVEYVVERRVRIALASVEPR